MKLRLLLLLFLLHSCRHADQPPQIQGDVPLKLLSVPIKDDLGYALAWSPNGSSLAVAHLSVRSFVLSLLTSEGALISQREICDASLDVHAVCFRPDGEAVAVAGDDGQLRIFQVSQDPPPPPIPTHLKVTGCVWLSNGLFLTSSDGMVTHLDDTGTKVSAWKAHESAANALSEVAEGKLATVGDDGTLKIWNPAGEMVHTVQVGGHLNDVQSTGESIVVARSAVKAKRTPEVYEQERAGKYPPASEENSVVWVNLKMEERRVFQGHRGTVVSATMWNSMVVSTGWDDSARIFDGKSGKSRGVVQLPWLGSRVRASPDGKKLAILGWAHPQKPMKGQEATLSLFAWE